MSDFKVKLQLGSETVFNCPDVMVACEPADIGQYHLSQPRLIAEVLSPSTPPVPD
jgi:Uma2 family endonuclease